MAKEKNVITVTLSQVPLKGKTETKVVEVPMTATTVGAMAEALGLDLKNRNVSINGKPATADTAVNAAAKVELRVTERPQGS